MSIRESLGDLDQQGLSLGPLIRAVARQEFPQRRPIHVLQRQIRCPIAGAEAQDLHDVRRVDPFGQLQLTLEAGDVIGIDGECRVQQLERDDLSRLLVAGLPDHAHAATAEFGQKREAFSHDC